MLDFITANLKPIASIAGGALSFLGGERRNRAEASNARAMMDFQRNMSNTAHQRQIRDLHAAGLNPILAAKYGGASSPSGAMSKPENTFEKAINSAFQVSQLQNMQAQVEKTNAQTREIDHKINEGFYTSDVGVKRALKHLHVENANLVMKKINTEKMNYQIARANNKIRNMEFREIQQRVRYFLSVKYPKELLVARPQNIIGTEAWLSMSPQSKNKLWQNVQQTMNFANDKINDFSKDPEAWLKRNSNTITGGIILYMLSNMNPLRRGFNPNNRFLQ